MCFEKTAILTTFTVFATQTYYLVSKSLKYTSKTLKYIHRHYLPKKMFKEQKRFFKIIYQSVIKVKGDNSKIGKIGKTN